MKKHKQNFVLGLATIVFIALLVGTIVFLYPMAKGGGRKLIVLYRVDQGMAPLKQSSEVILGGSINVGSVNSVTIEEREDPAKPGEKDTFFVVDLQLEPNLPLYGDCVFTTGAPAIGGNGYVEITNTGTPGVKLQEPILGHPPQTFSAAISSLSERVLAKGGLIDQISGMLDPNKPDSLMYKLDKSLNDVNQMTTELAFQLNPKDQHALLAHINRILDNVNETTATLRAEVEQGQKGNVLGKIHAALGHLDTALTEAVAMLKEDRPLVHSTLTSMDEAARAVNQDVIARLRAELNPDNPSGTLGKLHLAMDKVNDSLGNLQTITSSGEQLVAMNRPTIDQAIKNFEDMSEQLRLASTEVLLNPSKLIWGPSAKREQQLVIFQAARQFAEAASALDNASSRLQAVLQTLPPHGEVSPATREELKRIEASVQSAFQRFGQAEQTLWNQLK